MSVCRCTCNFSFCIQGEVDRRKGQIKSPTDELFIRGFSFLTIFFLSPESFILLITLEEVVNF